MTQGKFRKFQVCLAIITIVYFQHCTSILPECNTAECKKLGKMYTKNMNTRLDPCYNFYEYVCQGWKSQFPRPDGELSWCVERELDTRLETHLKEVLENKKKSTVPRSEEAKALYKACMSTHLMNQVKVKQVNQEMKGVVKGTWSQIDEYYLRIGGESAFFKNSWAASPTGTSITQYIRRPFSTYGAIKREKPWKFDELNHYKSFLKSIMETVMPPNLIPPKNLLDQQLSAVMNFREEFNKTVQTSGKVLFTSVDIQGLQSMYDKEAKRPQAKINWLNTIRAMTKNGKDANGVEITAATNVIIDSNYLVQVARFLGNWPEGIIQLHVHLYFAERRTLYNTKMQEDLSKSYEMGVLGTGNQRRTPIKWEWCVRNHNMRDTLGRMYVDHFFSLEAKKDVEEMFEEAKHLLEIQVSNSNWLDAATKNKTIKKVEKIKARLGYPHWYNPTMSPQQLNDVNPLETMAYFEQDKNLLYAGAAYLQSPLYISNVPLIVHYATTGTVFGHELYHGFETAGIQRDENGVERKWWPENMKKQFDDQVKCFHEQYTEYRKQEISKHKIKLEPGKLMENVDEDIADVMGLKLAYLGFQRKYQGKLSDCQTLYGFKKFSCEQLFFISYANTFCSDWHPSFIEKSLLTGRHSLPNVRVNGAMANMPEFSAAFECSVGSPMKRSKTCDLWKK